MKKMTRNRITNIISTALLAFGLMLAVAHNAMAAGTPSGTSVGNIATINYSVDGTAQPEVGSTEGGNTSGPGSETTFLVGTIINLTLIEGNTTHTSVAAGSLLQATSFTLTNLGNDSQGYNLTAANSALAVFGEADDFDVGTFAYYSDNNNDGLLDALDTLITSVNSLAPDGSIDLLVTATIPNNQPDNQTSAISLTAVTTADGTTVPAAETGGAFDSTLVAIVFGDGSTTTDLTIGDPGQTEGDATAVALDQYHVLTAALTVSKTVAVYSDPANGTTVPKAIPGAILTYTITIVNGGTGTATDISISDEIAAGTGVFNTLYNDGVTTCTGAEGIAVKNGSEGSPVCKSNASDADSADFTGIIVTAAGLTLAGGQTATIAFQITIQ
jgi:uncharacterized repeat protein (TIGR01451 family)